MNAEEILEKGREEFGVQFYGIAAWLCEQLQEVYGDEIGEVLEDIIREGSCHRGFID